MPPDLSYTAAIVLHAIRCGRQYGFQIMASVALPSGTVYPILRRLEKSGLIRSRWEKASIARAHQRPTRKYYEVSPDGELVLAEAAKRYRFPELEPAPQEADQ